MTYELDVTLPGLPRLQTNNYGHWATRYRTKRRWEDAVAEATLGQRPPKPLERARVECTRFSTREPDRDNLAASCKPLIDGLTRAGIIVDDRPSVIGSPVFKWEKTARGTGRVRIRVWGGDDDDRAA